MNRQIKFRAWDKSCNKMRGIKGLQDCFSLRSDGVSNDDYILMQFTGLQDKNGKEIYEGDIDNRKRVCEYFPNLGCFGFRSPMYSAITFLGQFITSGNIIIGNIYENPELLKDK